MWVLAQMRALLADLSDWSPDPIHEVVKVDYFIPGCPPSGDAIWKVLTALLAGREPELGHGLMHYD